MKTENQIRQIFNFYRMKIIAWLWLGLLWGQVAEAQFVQKISKKASFPGLTQLNAEERALADTLLREALDHEALYSLCADLKPISTIRHLHYPVVKDSTMRDGDRVVTQNAKALAELARYQKVLNALSFGQLYFVMVPFKAVYNKERNLQILVCRRDLLDKAIRDNQAFFGQWGFTPGTSPEVLLTVVEFEAKHDRYRAYGYLFGYPEHAVDFFVKASQSEEKTKEFVKRDFFDIPVWANRKGHFTYALPKGYQTTGSDSAIYRQAMPALKQYEQWRAKYTKPSGVASVELLRDFYALPPRKRALTK
jgi:hypothetical protein